MVTTTGTSVTVGEIRIGTSGWHYPHWRGDFYPRGLQQRLELEFISRMMNSVELNGSFYGLRRPTDYHQWVTRTPDDFVFAVKGHQEVTHVRRLREPGKALEEFFDSGVLDLGPKLGPVLWQLPPTLPFKPDRLAAFLELLPGPPVRHALEVRHPSYDTAELPRLLEKHGVALVLADSAGRFPVLDHDTADFRYVRLHGDQELYISDYSPAALDWWARRVCGWATDVYVYFDNTMHGFAPHNALAFADRLR
jgi:uncharacterized protein YecE (DUF72 family)